MFSSNLKQCLLLVVVLSTGFASYSVSQIPALDNFECKFLAVGAPNRFGGCVSWIPGCALGQHTCPGWENPKQRYGGNDTEQPYWQCVPQWENLCRYNAPTQDQLCRSYGVYRTKNEFGICVDEECIKSTHQPLCF
jgi:hypothetical protein